MKKLYDVGIMFLQTFIECGGRGVFMGAPKDGSLHAGHRERLRKRFLSTGFEGMEEHVVLELLLFYSVPRIDTNELAHRLINKFGSLRGVCSASFSELMSTEGVGENTAVLLMMIPHIVSRYMNGANESLRMKKAISRQELGEYAVNALAGETTEAVLLLCLRRGRLVREKVLARGGRACVEFSLSSVASELLICGCDQAALAHTHPDGMLEPSEDDYRSTAMFRTALGRLGVEFFEHYIVSGGTYVCMSQYI